MSIVNSLDQCKENCINNSDCNCITYNTSSKGCGMHSDCDDIDNCESLTGTNTYTYDKPGYLQGYNDNNWTTNERKHCYAGHGVTGDDPVSTYGNIMGGNDQRNTSASKNTLEHCKKSCFEHPDCNCITMYPSNNLCYLRKDCNIDQCPGHNLFNVYTYS